MPKKAKIVYKRRDKVYVPKYDSNGVIEEIKPDTTDKDVLVYYVRLKNDEVRHLIADELEEAREEEEEKEEDKEEEEEDEEG